MNILTKASITERLCLRGTLSLVTPLLIGAGKDDNLTDILILRNKDGNPIIPGTSFAGVLRSFYSAHGHAEGADLLFGSMGKSQSPLVISDIELKKSKVTVRDGVRIEEDTGVAAEQAKFDYEIVERGAKGNFEIIVNIRGFQSIFDKEEDRQRNLIVNELKLLARRLTKGISIGAKTNSGFGKVVCKKVEYYDYNFKSSQDVAAWVLDEPKKPDLVITSTTTDEELGLAGIKALCSNIFSAELQLHIKNSLIVRDYNDDETNAIQMRSGSEFVVPGPSVRGVIRHQAQRILRRLNKNVAMLDDLFGYANKKEYENVPNKRGRLAANEIYFNPKIRDGALAEFEQPRIRIDRFTGGTVDGALFTVKPVQQPDDTDILTMSFEVRKCKPEEAGLLLLVIKDICTGEVAFGGEKSIGRGVMEGRRMTLNYKDKHYDFICTDGKFTIKDGDPNELEDYVKALVPREEK